MHTTYYDGNDPVFLEEQNAERRQEERREAERRHLERRRDERLETEERRNEGERRLDNNDRRGPDGSPPSGRS